MKTPERSTYETLVSLEAQILAQQAIQAYLSKIITRGQSTTLDNLEHLLLASRRTTTELIALRNAAHQAHTNQVNSN